MFCLVIARFRWKENIYSPYEVSPVQAYRDMWKVPLLQKDALMPGTHKIKCINIFGHCVMQKDIQELVENNIHFQFLIPLAKCYTLSHKEHLLLFIRESKHQELQNPERITFI